MGRQGRMAKTKRLNILYYCNTLKEYLQIIHIYIYPSLNKTRAESPLNKGENPVTTLIRFLWAKNCCFSGLK